MQARDLKNALHEGQLVLGCWQQLVSPEVTEVLAYAGFDFVIFDLEHTSANLETIENQVRGAEGANVMPAIRISENTPAAISRVLDTGVKCIVLPGARTAEDAFALVQAVKYEPEGTRGFCRTVRATKYTTAQEGRPDYFTRANEEIVTGLIVETLEAVANFRQIASVDGLDFVLLGPGDLSAAMGLAGQVDHPKVTEKLRHVMEIAGNRGIATVAYVSSLDRAREWIKLGVTVILFSDVRILVQGCRDRINELRT